MKCLAAASLAALAASATGAETYSFSGWLAPTHPMTHGQQNWASMVREGTGGEIDIEVIPGAALIPTLSTLQAVGDNVVAGGHITPLYHPSEMPVNYVSGQAGGYIENPDFYVLSAAYIDYVTHDAAAAAEWAEYNVLPLLTISTPEYYFICNSVITSLEDMKGKRVRAPGGVWAAASEAFGMTAVNLPFSEVYTSMERGAVDCVLTDMANLTTGATIIDLARSTVMLSIFPAYNAGQVSLNRDFWKNATPEQRRVMLDAAPVAMAGAIVEYNGEVVTATEAAVARGMQIVEPTDEMRAVHADFRANWYDALVQEGKEQRGLANAEEVLAAEDAYITKWTELLKDLDKSDADAFARILSDEIYSKIDENVYGMN